MGTDGLCEPELEEKEVCKDSDDGAKDN